MPVAPTNVRWIVFARVSATSFLLYLHRYSWNIIGPQLQEEYSFTNTQTAFLFSLFYYTYATGTHDLAPRQFAPGFAPTTYNSCTSVVFPDNCTTDGQAGVDAGTSDVSPVKVNEKEPLSITDNGSGKSGRLDLN